MSAYALSGKYDNMLAGNQRLRSTRKDDWMSNTEDEIILRGLKANNLKNIDLNIKKKANHRVCRSLGFREELGRL